MIAAPLSSPAAARPSRKFSPQSLAEVPIVPAVTIGIGYPNVSRVLTGEPARFFEVQVLGDPRRCHPCTRAVSAVALLNSDVV